MLFRIWDFPLKSIVFVSLVDMSRLYCLAISFSLWTWVRTAVSLLPRSTWPSANKSVLSLRFRPILKPPSCSSPLHIPTYLCIIAYRSVCTITLSLVLYMLFITFIICLGGGYSSSFLHFILLDTYTVVSSVSHEGRNFRFTVTKQAYSIIYATPNLNAFS